MPPSGLSVSHPFFFATSGRLADPSRMLVEALRQRGVPLRRVLLAAPTPTPHPTTGWGTLDVVPSMLDVTTLPQRYLPHVLTDVRRLTANQSHVPYILVNPVDYVAHRLIASSAVPGLVGTADAPLDLLHDSLLCVTPPSGILPLVGAERPWVLLTPPADRLLPTPESVPFLAALATAPTLEVAARWGGLSRATRMLDQMCRALAIRRSRQTPERWFEIFLAGLATPPLPPPHVSGVPRDPV